MTKGDWKTKQCLLAWVFNVGRGVCVFLRTPAKNGVLVDCGGEKSSQIIPMLQKFVIPNCSEIQYANGKKTRTAQMLLSHPHADHIREIEHGMELAPYYVTCPHDKDDDEKFNWDLLENPPGTEGLLDTYKASYRSRCLPLRIYPPKSKPPGFLQGIFYLRPPECEPKDNSEDGLPKSDYANNTSIMMYLKYCGKTILLPGDMMPSGMKKILEKGSENRLTGDGILPKFSEETDPKTPFSKLMREGGCSVLVAPHHGLESGFCPEFFDSLPESDKRVDLVVVSEKAKPGKNDGKVHPEYQTEKRVRGMTVKKKDGSTEQNRRSITTRSDGHCLIGIRSPNELSVVISSDLKWILSEGPDALFV